MMVSRTQSAGAKPPKTYTGADVVKAAKQAMKAAFKELGKPNLSNNEKGTANELATLLAMGTLMSNKELANAVKEFKKPKAA